ncbi:hypothetical protein ZWY2020_014232 [Hordeum vulgare]|nr:hypothetical protein ZWY2020_014232 [Hordeum vulgare]
MVENESKFCVGDPKNVHLKQMDEARENLHLFRADVLDYDTLTRALEGCEGVFHLATTVPEDKIVDPEAEILAPAVKGTSNVLKACSAMKVQKILLFAVAKESSKFLPILKETAKSFKGKHPRPLLPTGSPPPTGPHRPPARRPHREANRGPPPKLQFFAWDSLLNLRDRDSSLLVPMAGLEELKKKLQPLLFDDSDKGGVSTRVPFPEDTCDSYVKINIFEKNDEDVKVVVGKSLDQIVLDESKDVLLESLEPIYNKLAKFLHGIDSLVIAKMDGTNNEHPRA